MRSYYSLISHTTLTLHTNQLLQAASLPESVDEVAKVLINVLVFILPVGRYGYIQQDWWLVGAGICFALP